MSSILLVVRSASICDWSDDAIVKMSSLTGLFAARSGGDRSRRDRHIGAAPDKIVAQPAANPQDREQAVAKQVRRYHSHRCVPARDIGQNGLGPVPDQTKQSHDRHHVEISLNGGKGCCNDGKGATSEY